MAKKILNERCPLQAECERKCEYQLKELDCDYYTNNGIGEDRTIPDQEERRREIERRRDEEQYEADLADVEDDDEPTERPEKGAIVYISVNELCPHPDNPRKDVGDVTELAESIKVNGILQNLTVVPNMVTGEISGDTWQRGYKVIIGHRRLAAAKMAGLEALPCVVVNMSEREQLSTMLTENMQRSDLTVYEQAQGFQMMLDMGDTVEDIAEKSGFSTTTVRRRVKLLELDKEKFKKSEERGATLFDYMELDKIEDPALKNEVLDSIGTNNFKMKLAGAIEKEKSRALIAERVQALSTFAIEVKEVDYSIMRYVRNYGTWNKKDTVERPEDADSVSYYYRVSDSQVDLYRQKIEEPKDLEVEAKKEQFMAEQDRRHAELVTLSESAYKARLNFIKEFSAAKKHSATICRFASGVFLRGHDVADDETMDYLLGVGIDAENDEIDTSAFEEMSRERPEYALLATAYASFDAEAQTYFWCHWDPEHQHLTSTFQSNAALDFLYEILAELGYEMSDDEKALQNGTHELFKEATDE